MKFRRVLSLLLVAALTLSLCSCGGGSGTADLQEGDFIQTVKKLGGYIFSPLSDATDKGEATEDNTQTTKKPVTVTDNKVPGVPKLDLLDFSVGKDMYGQKSINIIGDSISQGIGAGDMTNLAYDNWIKLAIKEKYGACNLGYTSLNSSDIQAASSNYELHTLKFIGGEWSRLYDNMAGKFPGCMAYKMGSTTENKEMQISFKRSADKINGSINGFYVYYAQGNAYGKFDLLINGNKVKTVDCSGSNDNCARTEYIALPQGCPDDVTVSIVKYAGYESVVITGMSYIHDPAAITVNNYALSGLKLDDVDPALIDKLCKANLVLFGLGFNDSGNDIPKDKFMAKLERGYKVCKNDKTPFVLLNFIWYDNGTRGEYRTMLAQFALQNDIYYLDLNTVNSNAGGKFLSDYAHPSAHGYKLIGNRIVEYIGLK